jgi:hypothetical protein
VIGIHTPTAKPGVSGGVGVTLGSRGTREAGDDVIGSSGDWTDFFTGSWLQSNIGIEKPDVRRQRDPRPDTAGQGRRPRLARARSVQPRQPVGRLDEQSPPDPAATLRHLWTTLALVPCAIATAATEAPGWEHSSSTIAFSSALCRRRESFLESVMVSTYLRWWTPSFLIRSLRSRMPCPDAYRARPASGPDLRSALYRFHLPQAIGWCGSRSIRRTESSRHRVASPGSTQKAAQNLASSKRGGTDNAQVLAKRERRQLTVLELVQELVAKSRECPMDGLPLVQVQMR